MTEEIKKHCKYNVQISNMGYIIRASGVVSHPTKKKDTGYYVINVERKAVRIHRLVAETFIPNPGNLSDVNHIDGDKSNNRADNLEWASRGSNIKHSYDSGLRKAKKGEESPVAKITLKQAQEIYDQYETDGFNSNAKQLAEKYKTSVPYIRRIITGKSGSKEVWPEVNRNRTFPANRRGGLNTVVAPSLRNFDELPERPAGMGIKVAQIDKNTGEILATFSSASEARRVTGINHIGNCANGRYLTAGGFKWEYLDE